jgi:L,D-peptidoglycan transpeptidase YkuD (ErfK/YbiS/YcfS/YnhG family)
MSRPSRWCSIVATVCVGLVSFAACGGDTPHATSRPRATEPTSAVAPSSTTVPSFPQRLVGTSGADQVVAVVADDYGMSTATLTAYERVDGGWRQVFGPWEAQIGSNGFAHPDEKQEGDDTTPSGTYAFDFAFGVEEDPGVRLPYRAITGASIVWDDDPTSNHYNEWVDTTMADAGTDPEPMQNVPAYSYGAVIAYNAARVPGRGSAIFLHVSTGSATAGCVSLPIDDLLAVLRWLDPARQPRIVMGTAADLATSQPST